MRARSEHHDVVVVGGGHNGLVAAALLARAGRSVLLLERRDRLGGAAVSERMFPGLDAQVSAYAYLVSLFPSALMQQLGIALELRRRMVSSYTPLGSTGLLVCDDAERTRASFAAVTGEADAFARWQAFYGRLARMAARIAPTLLAPLMERAAARRLLDDDDELWEGLFERPLAELVERAVPGEVPRGVALTDAMIGTFAAAGEPSLRQNRCFLYHVIGDGTGLWRLPVGGMGALTGALVDVARRAGAELRTGVEVAAIEADARGAEVSCSNGARVRADRLLGAVAPSVLAELLGSPPEPRPEGSQLKLNLLLARLPRLRDPSITPEEAFAGTFHVNESDAQLQRAYEQAAAGAIPSLVPCEAYCHSLGDPSILGPSLRAAGAHTLTVFALHMPARLFAADPAAAKRDAVAATLRSLDSVLGEPLEDSLWRDADGAPCLEARTPVELEQELAMPGGHIFHRDLSWPFAEATSDVGRWGVETECPSVLLCGAGARRGGGVSGIPGHNAAQALSSGIWPCRR